MSSRHVAGIDMSGGARTAPTSSAWTHGVMERSVLLLRSFFFFKVFYLDAARNFPLVPFLKVLLVWVWVSVDVGVGVGVGVWVLVLVGMGVGVGLHLGLVRRWWWLRGGGRTAQDSVEPSQGTPRVVPKAREKVGGRDLGSGPRFRVCAQCGQR